MRHWTWWAALAGVMALPGALGAQQPAEKPVFRTGAAAIELGGRAQVQFVTTSVEDEEDSRFLLRRVRLEAKVKVNDWISGKIQPDFAGNRVSLKDVFMQLDFSPGAQLLAGKAHRPFSRLEQTSSVRMPPIERGLVIPGVAGAEHYELISDLDYSGRDIGLQLLGEPDGAPLGLGYAVGVFAGPLEGRVGGADPLQLAARVTLEPLEQLGVGAGWSSRDFAVPFPDTELVGLERGHAWEVDFEYGGFDRGLHVLGEWTTGDVDPLTGQRFRGAQAWLGYRTPPLGPRVAGVEPLFRASWGDLDGGALPLGGTLLTPGVNVYLAGLNRVQLNYDVWIPEVGDAEGSFKAQFQLHF